MVSKAVQVAFGPAGQHDGTDLGKAIQRKLGLDDPQGKTSFLAQNKTSHVADLTQRTDHLYPLLREEIISKLAGEM